MGFGAFGACFEFRNSDFGLSPLRGDGIFLAVDHPLEFGDQVTGVVGDLDGVDRELRIAGNLFRFVIIPVPKSFNSPLNLLSTWLGESKK